MSNRIGLITIHETTNFGSQLQAFSLYSVIEKLGYDIEIINYRNHAIAARELPIKVKDIRTIKTLGKFLLYNRAYSKKFKAVFSFLQENCRLSSLYDKTNIKNANENYDTFIVGSDIVWGLNITGKDYTYFLDFVDKDKRKISFASSVGTIWSDNEVMNVKKYLSKFDRIAVRESIAKEWIQPLINKEIKVVCDPTMLITAEEWKKYVTISHKQRYVLIYFRDPESKIIDDAKAYAKQHGCQVFYIEYKDRIKGIKTVRPNTIQEFLSLIYYAECVFSASYHGMLFALYFNKPLFYYNRSNKSRMEDLADYLNIQSREGRNENLVKDEGMNYIMINKKIKELREYSTLILTEFLEDSGI